MCDNVLIVYASTEGGFISKNRITEDNIDEFDEGDIGEAVGGYSFRLLTDKGAEILPRQVRTSLLNWASA